MAVSEIAFLMSYELSSTFGGGFKKSIDVAYQQKNLRMHVTTDIYGGLVGYILHKSEPENSRVNDVATVSSEEYTDLGN